MEIALNQYIAFDRMIIFTMPWTNFWALENFPSSVISFNYHRCFLRQFWKTSISWFLSPLSFVYKRATDFCDLILYSTNIKQSVFHLEEISGTLLKFSICFEFGLSICHQLMSFTCLISVAKISSTILHTHKENTYPVLFLNLIERLWISPNLVWCRQQACYKNAPFFLVCLLYPYSLQELVSESDDGYF